MTSLPLGPVTPTTKACAQTIAAKFPKVPTIGGYRVGTWGYHRTGQALDVMVGKDKALGDAVAAWAIANHATYGIDEVIWWQRFFNPNMPAKGWRPMSDRGGNTANHKDHVHLSVDWPVTKKPAGTATPKPGTSTGGGVIDSAGASVLNTGLDVLKGMEQVGSFFAALGQRSTWVRILQVTGGAGILIGGVVLVGRSTIASTAVQAVMTATPAGRAVGVASTAAKGAAGAAGTASAKVVSKAAQAAT